MIDLRNHATAFGGEPAKEPNFVIIDEGRPPAPLVHAREHSLLCRLYASLARDIREDCGAEFAANAYRMTDKLNVPYLQSGRRHRIDVIV